MEEKIRRESSFIPAEAINFSPHCCCCGWVEHFLINCQCCGSFCGCCCYIPFMSLFYLLWILQIPITILLNFIAFVFCCNFCKCQCCRGSLFIADDDSIPDAMNDGVMLHTAESIKNLHIDTLSADKSDDNGYSIQAPPDSPKSPSTHHDDQQNGQQNGNTHIIAASESGGMDNNDDHESKTSISILQWNVFGQLGRYWKRFPLIATQINDLSPDIISINEAVTVKWWRFGTVNMIKHINPRYRGFHVSAYNVLHDYNKIFFQYSCCWRILNEYQSCCNLYFMIPFWREKFWKYSLKSNICCSILFNTFIGIIAQIGNAILFKNNYQLFRSYIPLQGGNRQTALRALYIIKDKNKKAKKEMNDDHSYGRRLSLSINKNKRKNKRKKIWIVNTHLTLTKEQKQQEQDEKDEKDEIKENEENEEIDDEKEEMLINDENGLKQINQIIKWMEEAQKKICKADAIIICGDFNATPTSNVYKYMISKGYKSVVATKKLSEQWTFPTDTWRYNRDGLKDDEIVYDHNNPNPKLITKDYIWIKDETDTNIIIDDVRLIGRQYIDYKHKSSKIKIYPSDHLGIYCKISI